MTPRSIALQGIGYGALLVALQGFGGQSVTQPPVFGGGVHVPRQLRPEISLLDRDEEDLFSIILAALPLLERL